MSLIEESQENKGLSRARIMLLKDKIQVNHAIFDPISKKKGIYYKWRGIIETIYFDLMYEAFERT